MLSDMLFENTHSVEQLVDIKKKKKVDKVLLKVIKTIRSRTGIFDWIKPESDLKKDFNITDKTIASICDVLNEYYQIEIDPKCTGTVRDIVQYIKCHQQTAADSIFLVDSSTLDIDENDDTIDTSNEPKENLEVDPEVVKTSQPSNPTEEKVPEGSVASTEKDKIEKEQEEIKQVEKETTQEKPSQESYSMENLQINKEEDDDWGSMLNSF